MEYNHEHRAYPPCLKKYVERFHYYRSFGTQLFDMEEDQLLERERLSYIHQILRDHPCDVVSIYSRLIDSACHSVTPKHEKRLVHEKLVELYSFMDNWVRVLTNEIVKPDAILVFSDHGFNPLKRTGNDWRGHNRQGAYIFYSYGVTHRIKPLRTYQINWVVKDILALKHGSR